MRKSLIAAITSGLILLAALPAQASGTLTGATGHASATVTVQDAVFDGPDCLEVPYDATYAKTPTEAEEISLTVKVSAGQQGSNAPRTGSTYIGYYDPASATSRGDLYVCPSTFSEVNGPVTVTGTLTSNYYVNGSEQTVDLQPPATMALVKNTTTMSSPRVTKGFSWAKDSRRVSGKVTAATLTKGTVGADGKIEIAVRYPKSKKWVRGDSTYPDEFGNWSTTVSKAPKGSKLRVTLVDCGWCTNAQKVVTIRR